MPDAHDADYADGLRISSHRAWRSLEERRCRDKENHITALTVHASCSPAGVSGRLANPQICSNPGITCRDGTPENGAIL